MYAKCDLDDTLEIYNKCLAIIWEKKLGKYHRHTIIVKNNTKVITEDQG